MKIQYLNGGLANQVFQYIFARYAQLSSPNHEPCYLDDSFFYVNQVHNGYELEKAFNLHPALLSRQFDTDVWNMLLENKRNGISMPQSLKNLGFSVSMVSEFDNYKTHNPFDGQLFQIPGNTYHPEILQFSDEIVYYHGYWLHPSWLNKYKDILMSELRFPAITDTQNLHHLNTIQNTTAVAVHIRRGDYVTLGWDTPNRFYQTKLHQVFQNHSNAYFYVFSDDIPWCQNNATNLGFIPSMPVTYVEGNLHGTNYIDMQLMSHCQILIAGRSAFPYLAYLLSTSIKECHFDS